MANIKKGIVEKYIEKYKYKRTTKKIDNEEVYIYLISNKLIIEIHNDKNLKK